MCGAIRDQGSISPLLTESDWASNLDSGGGISFSPEFLPWVSKGYDLPHEVHLKVGDSGALAGGQGCFARWGGLVGAPDHPARAPIGHQMGGPRGTPILWDTCG